VSWFTRIDRTCLVALPAWQRFIRTDEVIRVRMRFGAVHAFRPARSTNWGCRSVCRTKQRVGAERTERREAVGLITGTLCPNLACNHSPRRYGKLKKSSA